MAPSEVPKPSTDRTNPPKLPRLPKSTVPHSLRPLLHPPIPSPYTNASHQKVVYISAKTPFISAVKRVRKLLEQIDKRAVGKIDLINVKGSDKQKLKRLGEQVASSKIKESEEVVMKATNRAIERALGLGLYFQGQDDVRVRIRTGSVGAVDDIVAVERGDGEGRVDLEMGGVEDGEEEGELPETRIRHTSSVEVAITLR
ncbi:MAG: hypothetical protein Q9164_002002 [Protoblastenia rupestris]